MTPLRWFGDRTTIPYPWCTEENYHAGPIPVPCEHCDEAIAGTDSGVILSDGTVFHAECWARMLFGSANHQVHTLEGWPCPGSYCADDPALSKRDNARAALATMRRNHGAPW